MRHGRSYIGTSGWSYAHWARGRFYPPGLRAEAWLEHYARYFDTSEINATFYRRPTPQQVQRWRSRTPARFRFAVKLWRRVTHIKRLANCDPELRAFLEVAGGLARRRGPLLVQLPPTLRPDPQRLDGFLDAVRRLAAGTRWRVAVEFRNPAWVCADILRVLDRRRAALCLSDLPRCPVGEPNRAAFVYVRRHGPGGGYRGRYTPEHIAADAARVQAWLADGRDVYVYYNNDIGGDAVDNAQQLRAVLERRERSAAR